MLLTDPALQYWSCVVAILATIAVLILWNKVQGPTVVRGLSRFGLLLGGYLTTAVAVLVSVNIAYGGLIVSVSDLFADINPPMGQFMHHHGTCGGGPGGGPGIEAQAAPSAQYPDLAARQARSAESDHGDGRHGGRTGGDWGQPCPATPTSTSAASSGTQVNAANQSQAKP